MYVAQLSITPREGAEEDALDALNGWLGALRHNGQIHGREFAIARSESTLVCNVLLPALDALDEAYAGRWVHQSQEQLNAATVAPPEVRILGKESESTPPCCCPSPAAYILYTTFLALES